MTTQYDGKLAQARMAIADEWVRTIMRPILASGLIDNVTRLANLDDGHDMEWILDTLASERQCEKCEGEGDYDTDVDMDDCDHCDETGDMNGDDPKAAFAPCTHCERQPCPGEDGHDCEEGRVELGEILEYWIVEERAERRLREAGETMIDANDIGLGCAIWCRRTTGQGIAGDGVIMECAEAFADDCPWLLDNVNAEHAVYWLDSRVEAPEDIDSAPKGAE